MVWCRQDDLGRASLVVSGLAALGAAHFLVHRGKQRALNPV